MESLFYLYEQNACNNPKSDCKSEYKWSDIKKGEKVFDVDTSYNHLLFLKEGKICIKCNDYQSIEITGGEFILIHKTSKTFIEVIETGVLLVFTFDVPRHVTDNLMLQSYKGIQNKTVYEFTPIVLRDPLLSFVEVLIQYLQKGIGGDLLCEIKERELFLLLRSCYTPEEIVKLLHPIIGVSDFKNFVLKNYQKVKNVTELVTLSGMGRTAFDYTFREVFGMSARQWMLKQIAQQVLYKAMEPEITIKDLMKEFKFNSATHFNRFCKKQFNCTPTELIQKSCEKQFFLQKNE